MTGRCPSLKVEQPSEWDSTYSGVKLPEPLVGFKRKQESSEVQIDWFRTSQELFDWGYEEHNCVFEMTQDVLDQRIILLKVLKPVRGTLKLEQDSSDDPGGRYRKSPVAASEFNSVHDRGIKTQQA